MSTFDRILPTNLTDERALEENPWFADMLSLWKPAGDLLTSNPASTSEACAQSLTEEKPKHLRLANRSGKSVAKIDSLRDGKLRAHIHGKYVHGDGFREQAYATLTNDGVLTRRLSAAAPYMGSSQLSAWIDNVNGRYLGDEKMFVDLVVARNHDIIDLEMALPAYLTDPKERVSPRMDLVALEPAGDRWRIVFWEAKLVNDSRLRCRGEDVMPEVVTQLDRYTTWLQYDNHSDLVAKAYQGACRLLVKLNQVAKRVNPQIADLGPGIVAASAADAPPLLVDDKPRLLIDARSRNPSFTQNGHRDKLLHNGRFVQMVHGPDQMTLEAGH
jgi:hypothetical protein